MRLGLRFEAVGIQGTHRHKSTKMLQVAVGHKLIQCSMLKRMTL